MKKQFSLSPRLVDNYGENENIPHNITSSDGNARGIKVN
jgi:hypothetical protein